MMIVIKVKYDIITWLINCVMTILGKSNTDDDCNGGNTTERESG